MNDKEKLIIEEQGVLDNTLDIINYNIELNNNIIKGEKTNDINSYKKVDESERIRAIKAQKELSEIKGKPYFCKINILYDGEEELEKVYIGKKDVFKEDELIIASWAAPIYDIYNRFGIQKFQYIKDEKSGKKLKISGEICQKRKIDINNGKVINVISEGQEENSKKIEEFVKKKIESSNANKLGSIIETIQLEQNEIIRLPIEYNTLVQGCAGSGKSSVAFHRLAYLIYTYKLEKESVLVISPNNIFKNYTAGLMIDLGNNYEVNQLTFLEYAKSVLKSDFDLFKNEYIFELEEVNKLKSSKKFKELLDKYIEVLLEEYLPKDTIYVDGFKLIDYEEIYDIWINRFSTLKINDRVDKFKLYLKTFLSEKSKKIFSLIEERYKIDLQNIEKYFVDKKEIALVIKDVNFEKDSKLKRINIQCERYITAYLKKLKKVDLMEIYYELITNKELQKRLAPTILDDNDLKLLENSTWKIDFDRSDIIPALYLSLKLSDSERGYRHIIVDECQDLSYLEVSIVELISRTFTLVGDFNQSIDIYKNSVTYKEIEELFNKYTYFNKYSLNKSFRNSRSITNFANEIMLEHFMDKNDIPIAFARDSKKPVICFENNYKSCVDDIIHQLKKENMYEKNIGIICKTKEVLETIKNILSNSKEKISINYIDDEKCEYKQGINIVLVHLSKGLEFDSVFIIDTQDYLDSELDRKLLYVACTRALHELRLYTNSKDSYLYNISSEFWEENEVFAEDSVVSGLQNTILDVIVKNKKYLSEEVREYITSINNTEQLLKIIQEITVSRDVDVFLRSAGLLKKESGKVMESYSIFASETIKEKFQSLQNNEQKEVATFILNNMDVMPCFRNVMDLSKEINKSVSIINRTLMILNLGTFNEFIKKLSKS